MFPLSPSPLFFFYFRLGVGATFFHSSLILSTHLVPVVVRFITNGGCWLPVMTLKLVAFSALSKVILKLLMTVNVVVKQMEVISRNKTVCLAVCLGRVQASGGNFIR